jgi:Protein of unknown function (DUF2860)
LDASQHLSGKQRLSFMGVVIAMLFAQNTQAEDVLVADAASEGAINQQFLEGMSFREAGDYEASIAAFLGVLSSEPTLGRVRAELAVSYYRALNFAAAHAEAEKVLADPKTPDGVKLNVQYFLDEMDKQSKPHVFTPYVTFGFGHDTNINAGPSSGTINLGGGQIGQLASGASPISNNFNMLNLGLAHRYLSPTPIKAFGRSAAYVWQSNLSYYRNDYFSSGDFDLDVFSLSTGPLAVVAERWRMGVDFTYDYVELGHDKLVNIYGVAPTVTWNVSKYTDITLGAKFQKREYDDDVAAGRDSDYQSVNLDAGSTFFDSKLSLQIGAGLFNETAETNRFSNDGYKLSAGANWRIAPNDSLYIKDVYKSSQFDGNEVLFNESRDENENRATIGFNHKFVEKYVKDWTMDASITYTENDSNVTVYEYKRTLFALNFGKYF